MNTLSQSRYSPLPLFLAAALFIFFGPIFWMGVEAPGNERALHLAENSALFQQVAPSMHYGFSRLRQFDFPLWNNMQLCGTPYFANPHHGILQPLNAVFLFVEAPRAMALHAFTALSLMGLFFVLFMRAMHLRYIPAILGGVVYVCCGATAAVMSRPAYVNALVWLPLLCCVMREYVHRPRAALTVCGGVITAFLLVSGVPLMVLVTIMTAFAYGLAAILIGLPTLDSNGRQDEYNRWIRLRGLTGMLTIGILMTAVQWLPTFFWLRTLDAPLEFLTEFAVAGEAPKSLRELFAQLLEAHTIHLPALGYFGVISVLLFPAAIFHNTPRWERIFIVLLVFGALFLVFGGANSPSSEGPFLALAYPACFAAAVLTALGADRLFAARRDPLTPRLWGPLLLCGAFFVFLFIVAPDPIRGRMAPFAAAVVLFALVRTHWAGALSSAILLIFLFIDLNASMVIHQAHPSFGQRDRTLIDARLGALLRETALDDRILISAYPNHIRLHNNIGMSNGLRMAGGLGLPLTFEQRRWWEALGKSGSGEGLQQQPTRNGTPDSLEASSSSPYTSLLNSMGVRAVATAEGGSFKDDEAGLRLRRRGSHDDVLVYANEGALNRIRWTSHWQISLDISAAIEALSDPDFDGKRECIVVPADTAISHLVNIMPDQRPATTGILPDQESSVRLQVHDDRPEHLSVTVANPTPGILVVSDTYDASWRAYVNGIAAPVLRVNGIFRGIALPAGDHRVEFRYRPIAFYIGALISALTLLLLLMYGIYHLLRWLKLPT